MGKSKAFVNTILSIIWKDLQYQLEKVMDWAAHLEHLQTVLWEFDADAIISKPVLICLFCNGLQTFIHAQVKQDGP